MNCNKMLLILLPVVLWTTATFSQTPEKGAVMMKMLELKTALLKRDSISLTKLLSDDVSYGHSNGLLQTRAQLIRDVMSGTQEYKSIEPYDMNIRIYENSAIVTVKSKIIMTMQGKVLNLSMNVLLVWIFKNNDWQLVGRQSVKNN